MTLNDIVFKGDGLEDCYDRPHIEIAWDQWSRTRIFCKHGVFEGISDFMDLEQGLERAMKGFRASLGSGIHNCCWEDCPVPPEWIEEGSWSADDTSDCDLIRGHSSEHRTFPDDAAEDEYWSSRRVYFINGRDVTGKREIPKPIGAPRG